MAMKGYSTFARAQVIEKRQLNQWRASYYIYSNRLIGLVVRVFANGPGDLGSIPGRIIPKSLKMVLDTPLLNTQQYKVRIKGKVENSLPYTSVLKLLKREPSGRPQPRLPTLLIYIQPPKFAKRVTIKAQGQFLVIVSNWADSWYI